jgi:hypothetical protein
VAVHERGMDGGQKGARGEGGRMGIQLAGQEGDADEVGIRVRGDDHRNLHVSDQNDVLDGIVLFHFCASIKPTCIYGVRSLFNIEHIREQSNFTTYHPFATKIPAFLKCTIAV